MSKSIEALENIVVTFDEMGFVPTTSNPNSNFSFSYWFGGEYNTIKQDLERLEVLELNLDSEKYRLVNENQCLKNRVEDLEISYKELKRENQELKEQNKLFDETIEADDRIICQLTSELDTFKLAFYTLWKCCNKSDIPSDIESDIYLEFKCGYESLCIPVTEQEIDSIKKACELLDMEVKEVLGE